MMKRLFPLFLALLLTACAKDDLTTGGVAAVPIRISVMTGNAATGRTPGDPGEAETYTLPKVAYIYLLAYDGANETGNLQLLMPAGADAGTGAILLDDKMWAPSATDPGVYDYQGVLSVELPNTFKSGRVYVAAADRRIYDLALPPTGSAADAYTKLTYTARGEGATALAARLDRNEFMKNLYATPYNLGYKLAPGGASLDYSVAAAVTDANKDTYKYYGTVLEPEGFVPHVRVTLYHVATRLDVKWNVAAGLREDNALTYMEVQDLPESGCYLFRPTENVVNYGVAGYASTCNHTLLDYYDDSETAAVRGKSFYPTTADYEADRARDGLRMGNATAAIGTAWEGRKVLYVPQHYAVTAGGNVYPFHVRLGTNGHKIMAADAAKITGCYYGDPRQFNQTFTPNAIFTSWLAVDMTVSRVVDNHEEP